MLSLNFTELNMSAVLSIFCNATELALISLLSRFLFVLELDGIPQFWNTVVPRVLEWCGVPCPICVD